MPPMRQGGTIIVEASRSPICDAARALHALGHRDDSILAARHHGSDIVSMRGPLWAWRRLTVREDRAGPRFVRWQAFSLRRVSPPVRVRPEASAVSVLLPNKSFRHWQPVYADYGIPTFSVQIAPGAKKPMVSNYGQFGLPASTGIARKFPDATAIGFMVGRRTGLTVLDVDTPDERVLADALDRYGPTPVIVRSGDFRRCCDTKPENCQGLRALMSLFRVGWMILIACRLCRTSRSCLRRSRQICRWSRSLLRANVIIHCSITVCGRLISAATLRHCLTLPAPTTRLF
jgi:hypothetical protein